MEDTGIGVLEFNFLCLFLFIKKNQEIFSNYTSKIIALKHSRGYFDIFTPVVGHKIFDFINLYIDNANMP